MTLLKSMFSWNPEILKPIYKATQVIFKKNKRGGFYFR